MRAKRLSGLLKKGDRIAVSNITGREASKVSAITQDYCGNIVGGWALAKGGRKLDVGAGSTVPVFATCAEMYEKLPASKAPNKIIIYSPPGAVYGDVKEAVEHGKKHLKTLFIITEHVSIEVTAKIRRLCDDAKIDVLGCNTLGVINAHDQVRTGAVGGDAPTESFVPGSATIISNSGNMVNTIAGYMLNAGIGTHFGVSTGKDTLILTPLVELLKLANRSDKTRLIILYVEPGGLYEEEAIEWMRKIRFEKPVLVYVAGSLLEHRNVSLGHAGAVVEGPNTSASGKMAAFDNYFGREPFRAHQRPPKDKKEIKKLQRGVRVTALHHLPQAAAMIFNAMGWERDLSTRRDLKLNPWFADFGKLEKELPPSLALKPGRIPKPYGPQFAKLLKPGMGLSPARRNMRNASHASSLDGHGQRIGGYPLTGLMADGSFGKSLILNWTGELPRFDFEARLIEMTLIAGLSNGPGTISAQGAKLSASAGNSPNVGMIATLASIGSTHGGNGQKGVKFLLNIFAETGLVDPYDPDPSIDPVAIAERVATAFKKRKANAKEAGVDYERIPCVGHPIFKDEMVNYDPRERAIAAELVSSEKRNVFLEFYHALVRALHAEGASSKVWAVNMDAAIACVWLAVCWQGIQEKRLTVERVQNCAFLGFALGRVAGGAGEFMDHQDYGSAMDMRIKSAECTSLTRPRELPR